MSGALRCSTVPCPAPGPYRTTPDLAQHAWRRHGIEVTDTYALHAYRDQDVVVKTAPCGRTMAASDLPLHRRHCPDCLARSAPSAQEPPMPKPRTPNLVTAPCGRPVPAGAALGGHKGKCRACQAVKTQWARTGDRVLASLDERITHLQA
ncbi:MAG: hypothetical protein ACREMR_07680, partial [Gemmatimonadales bacterium]